ncbi:uncharacterized protein MELLADRAFT_90098 [Melampsora larici-populina 98AG31]|uniref:Metallothionein n=1 Tax=Melampsora larici-populina (strain 98AG31 / pathotype 3-4-7) TaxID=747676 RepID=F4RVN2_MELLP|nr:uncharacterized protein MELLADRAFT_90098 [Melampsora larici-populina 98AG31]EGG03386.1 hypothetical protein MELLADRAFT_90098 [Melampsora larici-populina 98AG31]
MPSCGCPDVKLESGETRACCCAPCSDGNLAGCSCNKETGCACPSTTDDPEVSAKKCVCPPGTCKCANCACKKAENQEPAVAGQKSCCS